MGIEDIFQGYNESVINCKVVVTELEARKVELEKELEFTKKKELEAVKRNQELIDTRNNEILKWACSTAKKLAEKDLEAELKLELMRLYERSTPKFREKFLQVAYSQAISPFENEKLEAGVVIVENEDSLSAYVSVLSEGTNQLTGGLKRIFLNAINKTVKPGRFTQPHCEEDIWKINMLKEHGDRFISALQRVDSNFLTAENIEYVVIDLRNNLEQRVESNATVSEITKIIEPRLVTKDNLSEQEFDEEYIPLVSATAITGLSRVNLYNKNHLDVKGGKVRTKKIYGRQYANRKDLEELANNRNSNFEMLDFDGAVNYYMTEVEKRSSKPLSKTKEHYKKQLKSLIDNGELVVLENGENKENKENIEVSNSYLCIALTELIARELVGEYKGQEIMFNGLIKILGINSETLSLYLKNGKLRENKRGININSIKEFLEINKYDSRLVWRTKTLKEAKENEVKLEEFTGEQLVITKQENIYLPVELKSEEVLEYLERNRRLYQSNKGERDTFSTFLSTNPRKHIGIAIACIGTDAYVVLPFTGEDLVADSFASRLYNHLEITLFPEIDGEFALESYGYVGFHLKKEDESMFDKLDLRRTIMESAPRELGGSKAESNATIYLRIKDVKNHHSKTGVA